MHQDSEHPQEVKCRLSGTHPVIMSSPSDRASASERTHDTEDGVQRNESFLASLESSGALLNSGQWTASADGGVSSGLQWNSGADTKDAAFADPWGLSTSGALQSDKEQGDAAHNPVLDPQADISAAGAAVSAPTGFLGMCGLGVVRPGTSCGTSGPPETDAAAAVARAAVGSVWAACQHGGQVLMKQELCEGDVGDGDVSRDGSPSGTMIEG